MTRRSRLFQTSLRDFDLAPGSSFFSPVDEIPRLQPSQESKRTMSELPFWRALGLRYYAQGPYFKREFGGVVRKISVDAHFSCPNIDGTVGSGGCVFCDARSFSPSRFFGLQDLDAQINDGILKITRRFDSSRFIAYFQPSTNTHAPLDVLERYYRVPLRRPEIVGLAIGTRPDAVPDPVLDLLATLSKETWLVLELGLQSSKDASLRWINRGHDYACFVDATRRAQARGLRLGVHLILGLPGETRADNLLTARRIAALGFHSVKLHNLYVVRGTPLEALWRDGQVPIQSLEEYVSFAVDMLEVLPPTTVVERLAGEATEEFLLAPEWTSVKHCARNAIDAELKRRNSWQGKYYDPTWRDSE